MIVFKRPGREQAIIREYKSAIYIRRRVESPAPLYPGEHGALTGDFSRFILFFSPRCVGVLTTFRRKYQGAGTKREPLAGLRRGFAFDAILNRHAKITGRTHVHSQWRLSVKRYVMCELKSFHFMLVNRPSSKLGVQFVNVMMSCSRIRKRFASCMSQSRLISDLYRAVTFCLKFIAFGNIVLFLNKVLY